MSIKYHAKRLRRLTSPEIIANRQAMLSALAPLRNHERSSQKKLAVIIHLYYPESWPFFVKKLELLDAATYDLCISLPTHEGDFIQNIHQTHPDAVVVVTPNQGRDVLPFLAIAGELHKKGYDYFLKIHSKKSTHRKDGNDWMTELCSNLLPNKKVVDTILQTLSKPATGIIGPAGNYLSLKVNFEANGAHMSHLMKRMFSRQKAYEILQVDRSRYGFFAGTMLWARFDAIAELLDLGLHAGYFEQEKGQIDATFAHAIERVLNLLPEAHGKKMYQVDKSGVLAIAYNSGSIPDWSSVYIGPKPTK